jgi:uncharacterized membrane protein YdbT with pleckstrin-like domain
MAIVLRDKEEIVGEVNFHWSAFITAKIWAFMGGFAYLGMFINLGSEDLATKPTSGSFVWTGVIFFGPFVYKWLQNKFKVYVVTNQRVYIEEGILAKSKVDIPLNKVNDVSMKQGVLQRMFGSGNIMVLTGNDKPTVLKDIDKPDVFKNNISEMVEKRAA